MSAAAAVAASTTFSHEANVNNFHWTLAVKSVQESICTAMPGSAIPNALVTGAKPEVKSKPTGGEQFAQFAPFARPQ